MKSISSSMTPIHLIKLTVGARSVEDLRAWQESQEVLFDGKPASIVHTRTRPKRAEEIIETGGSIYRVINGFVCCRQKIRAFDSWEHPMKGTCCLIVVEPEIILTQSMPRRAFQGWRYFEDKDAPKDIGVYESGDDLPPAEMLSDLQEVGLV